MIFDRKLSFGFAQDDRTKKILLKKILDTFFVPFFTAEKILELTVATITPKKVN